MDDIPERRRSRMAILSDNGGSTMNRSEHLQWCKDRALEYVDEGNPAEALASMMSDLGKHDETRSSVHICLLGAMYLDDMRKFINDFN